MTLLALIAIIFFGFAVYNLTCAFTDIPTQKTSRMMMLARKQQGVKAEKLLDVYITKIAGLIAPYLKLDTLSRSDRKAGIVTLDMPGLILQNPDAEGAKLILNALLIGVFHILTSLRAAQVRGGDFLPFASVIQDLRFWQPGKERNFYERLHQMTKAHINSKKRPSAKCGQAQMKW